MSSKKILVLLILLLGFVYADSVRVSYLEYPKIVKQNTTNILFNITANYNFDDSGCVRAKVYLKDSTAQVNTPNDECFLGFAANSRKWTTKLPADLFLDAGTVSFTYIVEYSNAETGGYIRCPTANKCVGQIDINVTSNAQPTPPPPVNNSNSNSNNNSNSNSNSGGNSNSNSNSNSNTSTINPPAQNTTAPLTADEINALLNKQNSSSSQNVSAPIAVPSAFDFSSITSNSLFVPAVGSCCCITLLIILVVGGVVGYKRFRKPKMPRSKRRIVDVEVDEEEQQ